MNADNKNSNSTPTSNFLRAIIESDNEKGTYARPGMPKVITRFPPEPNGYLHIGHAKALWINFTTAERFGGKCNLRYDDTNPAKEDVEFVDAIEQDIRWLGFNWDKLCYGSDYFDKCYELAVKLIKEDRKSTRLNSSHPK